jgi:hypothetical protein
VKQRRRAGIVFIALVFSVTNGGFAQTDNSIFAPFVTHLRAEADGSTVRLSWVDSQSVKGPVSVLRSPRPFDGGPVGRESISAEVYYGRQNFVDTVPFAGTWYYFIVASDENRQRYEMVIPYQNMLEILVDEGRRSAAASSFSSPATSLSAWIESSRKIVTPSADMGRRALPQTTTVQTPAQQAKQTIVMPRQMATITALAAVPESGGIKITFVSTNPGKNAVIYRNIVPMTRLSDLLAADVAQLPGAKSPFFDSVKIGVPYYYAVVYDEDVRAGTALIAPGYNSTLYPVVVTEQAPVVVKPPPPNTEILVPEPPPSRLSLEAEAALAKNGLTTPIPHNIPSVPAPAYQPQRTAAVQTEPRVFQQDLENAPLGSVEHKLQSIVKESFLWRNWARAIPDLLQLLAVTANHPVDARARFYLGQAYFFTGAYTNAMTEFLAVQSRFPVETAGWIQMTLSNLSGKR